MSRIWHANGHESFLLVVLIFVDALPWQEAFAGTSNENSKAHRATCLPNNDATCLDWLTAKNLYTPSLSIWISAILCTASSLHNQGAQRILGAKLKDLCGRARFAVASQSISQWSTTSKYAQSRSGEAHAYLFGTPIQVSHSLNANRNL